MSDIELVIKIPENIRLALINNVPMSTDQWSICDAYIMHAIINGTPLPKGHGRLKDADHYLKMQWEQPDYSLMEDEPTIIEADKEKEE